MAEKKMILNRVLNRYTENNELFLGRYYKEMNCLLFLIRNVKNLFQGI